MDPLQQRVLDAITRGRLVTAGHEVVVGVSGGPDSVALLHALVQLKDRLGIRLHVAHVDHQVRPESIDDAAFVRDLAGAWGLSVSVEARSARLIAQRLGLSLEDAARRARYDALAEVARRRGARCVAVAHSADDQAETVLLRLLRGAGLAGLSAMQPARPLAEVVLIRPLLQCWRQEVTAYLQRHALSARQDTSNEDPHFTRNRIRRDLLPWLERTFNPNIKHLMTQFAQQCRADAEFLRGAAQRQWKRLVKPSPAGLAIRLAPFRRQPRAVQAQLIRLSIERLQGDLARFEYRHWLEIEHLVESRPAGAVVDLPGDVRVRKETDRLIVDRQSERVASNAWSMHDYVATS